MLEDMRGQVRYKLRPLMSADQAFLWEMLYQSLYVADGSAPFERSVLNQSEIARYAKDWGRKDDAGFVAVDEHNRPVGAIWFRLLRDEEKGFGYLDDDTPEIGMAVMPECRGQGIGTSLLSSLIEAAQGAYQYISLSVSSANPAIRLYQRHGFEEVRRDGGSITMRRKLRAG